MMYGLPALSSTISPSKSKPVPPINVDAKRLDSELFSFNKNASYNAEKVRSNAPAVVGKLVEFVSPPTNTLPDESIAKASPKSSPVVPINVEAVRDDNDGLNSETNASVAPLYVVSYTPDVVGKSLATVKPTTYTFPELAI